VERGENDCDASYDDSVRRKSPFGGVSFSFSAFLTPVRTLEKLFVSELLWSVLGSKHTL